MQKKEVYKYTVDLNNQQLFQPKNYFNIKNVLHYKKNKSKR